MRMIGRSDTPPERPAAKPKGFDDFDLRLGDVMRGERATMGKSLLDVQRELKIKAAYIAAIENADPSAFETQGFVAGYVRSYARYLGLDPEGPMRGFVRKVSLSRGTDCQRPPAARQPMAGCKNCQGPLCRSGMRRLSPRPKRSGHGWSPVPLDPRWC